MQEKERGENETIQLKRQRRAERTSSDLIFLDVTEQSLNSCTGNRVEVFVFQESVKLKQDHKQDGASLGSSKSA